eukprot:539047-Hanusia_phi.AAC.1
MAEERDLLLHCSALCSCSSFTLAARIRSVITYPPLSRKRLLRGLSHTPVTPPSRPSPARKVVNPPSNQTANNTAERWEIGYQLLELPAAVKAPNQLPATSVALPSAGMSASLALPSRPSLSSHARLSSKHEAAC